MDNSVNSKVRSFSNGRNYAPDRAETEFSTTDSSSFTPDMEKLVFAQAIDFIYHNQFNIIITLLLMQLAILVAMWEQADHTLVIGWFLAGILVLSWRYVLVSSYLKKQGDIGSPRRWAYHYAANSFFNGIIWGSATFLFFVPESVTNQVFLLAIALGMVVGSLVVNSYYLPSFFSVTAPVLLGTMSRLLMEGNLEYQGVTVITLAFFGLGIKIAKNTNKAMIQAVRLRFENLDLIQQLKKQKETAEEANQAKSKFLAAASHDLRQPLHALSLFTTLLDADNSRQKQQELIEKINRSQTALSGLLDTLLDISKLDAGIVETQLCDFELDSLFNHLIPEFESEAKEKGLYMRYAPSHLIVHSDPALLEIILRNILSNAIHYTNEGGITVKAEKTEPASQGSPVRIEIADTGIGIPLAKQQEIFREFHQLANPERNRAKGLGLGLAIVRRVSDLLNHDVNLKSIEGEQSIFSITLVQGNPDRVLKTAIEQISVSQYAFPDTVVMFIDDEKDIREGMQETLNDWGCIAMVATSGDDAVSQIQSLGQQPEVILSDYRLQGEETGVDAIHQIYSAMGRRVPALIITGDTSPDRLREARDSGYTLLHKPLQPAQIRAFIRNVVTRA